jgi:sugar phosphate isomerase/epimerase
MYLCTELQKWPATAPDRNVSSLALPWAAVREHVSPSDLDGRALTGAMHTAGCELRAVLLTPLTCLDLAAFERQTDDAYMQMQISERLGAELAIITSAHRGPAGREVLADAITRLAALADRMDLRLCLMNALGSAAEQAGDIHHILDRADSTSLMFCLDTLAWRRSIQNPTDALLSFANDLAAVRLADGTQSTTCPPGSGRGQVDDTLAALRDAGFVGPIIVDEQYTASFVTRYGSFLGE